MSRGYRVSWVSATGTAEGGDALRLSLCLLNILDAAEMAALLREELAAEGWTVGADGTATKDLGDGATATLSADGSEVLLRAESTREVTAAGTDAAGAEAALQAAVAVEAARAQATAARSLTALEPDLRAAVGEAVQRVYVRALKQKAASMGTVESVREGTDADGGYEVTIKVRV
jgi:hypothetical protein